LREAKTEARKALKARLKGLSAEAMSGQSQEIGRRVCDAAFFQESTTVAVYLTAPRLREVDTSQLVKTLLEAGNAKRTFVPVVLDSSSNMQFLHLDELNGLVEMPPFGIMEPTSTYGDGSPRQDVLELEQPLDLILMPGLGFDTSGGRLGRGGGYYDKFLEAVTQRSRERGWKPPLLVALAFTEQLMDEVPMGAHDQRVDILVTADNVHNCGGGGTSPPGATARPDADAGLASTRSSRAAC